MINLDIKNILVVGDVNYKNIFKIFNIDNESKIININNSFAEDNSKNFIFNIGPKENYILDHSTEKYFKNNEKK